MRVLIISTFIIGICLSMSVYSDCPGISSSQVDFGNHDNGGFGNFTLAACGQSNNVDVLWTKGEWVGDRAIAYVQTMNVTGMSACERSVCESGLTVPSGYEDHRPGYGLNPCNNDPQCLSCLELGAQDQNNCGSMGCFEDGIWVKITMKHRPNNAPDSSWNTVIVGGCNAASWSCGDDSGTGIKKDNVKDTLMTDDGVKIPECVVNGIIKPGSCLDNGYKPGDIPNDDKGDNSKVINPPDSIGLPPDSLKNTSDSLLTKELYAKGVNMLKSAIDSNTQYAIGSKGLLNSLVNASIGSAIQNGVNGARTNALLDSLNRKAGAGGNGSDTSRFDTSVSVDTSQWGLYDDSLSGVGLGGADSGGVWARLNQKLDSARGYDSSDTNITGPDSQRVSDFFSAFEVDWGDTAGCDCDSEAFVFNFMNKQVNINICQYDVSIYTKPFFKLLAVFGLYMFYRVFLFKLLFKMEQFLP